jgi:hypothetical protein
MKTLDEQWLAAKREYDTMRAQHGKRSIYAALAQAKLQHFTTRILRRDARKRAA